MKKYMQNQPDVVTLLSKIQEQLAALDRKVDSLVNRPSLRPNDLRPAQRPSFQQHHNAQVQDRGRHNDHQGRPMYRATCADCKKECELPFKPTGDRPVYCKECFSRRKTGDNFRGNSDHRPKDVIPVQSAINPAFNIPELPAKEKRRQTGEKRLGGKRKLFSKKKKK
jgi:CxxC-x17-CxxC domain-containing protein